MKISKETKIIALAIIILSFIIGFYFYPTMPCRMASHWNIKGEVDGYMSRFWGLFLMPIISVFLVLLFVLIPKIDPMKANIEKIKKHYENFIVLLLLFLFYLYILTIFWNIGLRFAMVRFLVPAFATLFYYCGVLIEKAKRNWFIGIRTPWTMSSEAVWNKTHRIGGRLFKLVAIFSLLGLYFQDCAFFFMLFPLLSVVIYTTIYSYFEYRKEIKS